MEDQDDFAQDSKLPELPKTDLTIDHIRFYKQCQILQWMELAKQQQQCFQKVLKKPKETIPQTIISMFNTELKIENIVVNTKLGCNINLELAACYLNNCEYDPRKLPGAMTIRMKDCCCIVSKKGNLRLMNCKSEDAIVPLIRCFARKLQIVSKQNNSILDENKIKLSKPQTQSIKASMNLMFHLISFEIFANKYEDDGVLYDPEIAPYIKITDKLGIMHIYASGKISFLGSKRVHDIVDFIQKWYPRLLEFKKTKSIKEMEQKRQFIAPMNQIEFASKISEKKLKLETLSNYLPFELAQLFCS